MRYKGTRWDSISFPRIPRAQCPLPQGFNALPRKPSQCKKFGLGWHTLKHSWCACWDSLKKSIIILGIKTMKSNPQKTKFETLTSENACIVVKVEWSWAQAWRHGQKSRLALNKANLRLWIVWAYVDFRNLRFLAQGERKILNFFMNGSS